MAVELDVVVGVQRIVAVVEGSEPYFRFLGQLGVNPGILD